MTLSTTRDTPSLEHPPAVLRWKNWPLVDHPRSSWAVPLGILTAGAAVGFVGNHWLLAWGAGLVLAVAFWQFLLPVEYEANPAGLCIQVVRHRWMFPWRAIRSYQPRSDGIVLFRRSNPTALDALRSQFVPYGRDEDETLCAVRHYLQHAVELPG